MLLPLDAGGVAVPLVSPGEVVLAGGAEVSAGGVVAELVESAGAAGAVVEESAGELGEVDCCLEHATMASALRHTRRMLRFMFHLTDWGRAIQASLCPVDRRIGSQAPFHPGPPRSSPSGIPPPSAMRDWYARPP